MNAEVRRASADGSAILYVCMLIFYWLLQYFSAFQEETLPGDFLYYLFVIPVTLVVGVLLVSLRTLGRDDGPALWIAAFVISVSLISLVRGDLATIATVCLLGGTIFALLVYRLRPSATLLNCLLLASIPLNVVFFGLGASPYFVVPGVAESDLWWRVSLFPKVAPSAFFAAVVLLVNIVDRSGRFRRGSILLSIYFLVFSGIRSALIGAFLAWFYYVLVLTGILRRPGAKLAYLPLALVAFVGFLLANQILMLLPDLGGGFLAEYVFRSTGEVDEAEAARTIYRTWIWSEHIRIGSENPLFGIGTFDFTGLSTLDPFGREGSHGSESFLTGLYARVGISALFLVAGLVHAILRGLNARRDIHMMIGILLFVAMLAYGSFINAYDFVFLACVGLLADPASRASNAETRQYAAGSHGVEIAK